MKRISVSTFWHHFRADRRGTVAIIAGLSIIGLVGTAGLGIDLYNALAAKSKLDFASDAAAIAAINTAQNYIVANSATQTDPALTNGAIAAGEAQAQKAFDSNAGAIAKIAATPVVTMSRSGQTINATITYQGASQNAFGPIFGVIQFNIGGTASSSLTMGKYLDFYLLLDVSGSMGLPTTDQGQQQLASISPDQKKEYPTGCAFACHFSQKFCEGNYCQGYNLARANNIELRADSVGKAVQALLSTAAATATIPNQYRIGLYPFIVHMGVLYAISNNLNGAQTAAGNLGTLLDQGQSTSIYGSGGTHFENAIPELNAQIKTVGNGSGAATSQPFVFLVTDGANNSQTYTTSSNTWCCVTGSPPANSNPQTMDPTLCTPLKNRGITVSVLYIPYPPINPVNKNFAGDEDDKVNALLPPNNPPNVPSTLKQCASPGFFYSAYTPQDITNAMQDMFAQSLAAARLTQ